MTVLAPSRSYGFNQSDLIFIPRFISSTVRDSLIFCFYRYSERSEESPLFLFFLVISSEARDLLFFFVMSNGVRYLSVKFFLGRVRGGSSYLLEYWRPLAKSSRSDNTHAVMSNGVRHLLRFMFSWVELEEGLSTPSID